MFYGIRMEEHIWELKLPHETGNRKRGSNVVQTASMPGVSVCISRVLVCVHLES